MAAGPPSRAVLREVETLTRLNTAVQAITKRHDTRYQALLRAIRGGMPFRWTGRDPDDRLVIFSERIATMKSLAERLPKDLKLKAAQVEVLHGGLSDVEQQAVVENFGNRKHKVRLLVCSDVASEGINLHYRCHRLIHYDMPWSLMVFQQRNGRIDRYGQQSKPEIVYLVSRSKNETIAGDQRILEVLRAKDEKAYENIGDPSVFMNVHSIEAEEDMTQRAIVDGVGADEFDLQLSPGSNPGDELLQMFLGGGNVVEAGTPPPRGASAPDAGSAAGDDRGGGEAAKVEPESVLSLFGDDLTYCEAALHHMRTDHPDVNFVVDSERSALQLDAPGDLEHRFSYFPKELWPDNRRFELTADREEMSRAIDESRRDERAWPRRHYLWRQNPVVEWLNDRMLASFGRHQAPVLTGVPDLAADESVFTFSGMVPNSKSHPLVCVWCAVAFRDGQFVECGPLEELLERTGLARGLVPNRGLKPDLPALRRLRAQAVAHAKIWIRERADEFEEVNNRRLDRTLAELEALKQRQLAHAHSRIEQSRVSEVLKQGQLRKKQREIRAIFDDYLDWVESTMTLATEPWVRVLCVMTGSG